MYGNDLIEQIGYDKFCSAVSQGLQGRKRIGYAYVSNKEREEYLYNTVIKPKEDRILKRYTLDQLRERENMTLQILALYTLISIIKECPYVLLENYKRVEYSKIYRKVYTFLFCCLSVG